jgi:PAS domain S-box-containing protein
MKQLQILLLEDEPMDAYLIKKVLEKSGTNFSLHKVVSRDEFAGALEATSFDVIIGDQSLPQFNAIEAFSMVKKQGLNVPFILITGSVSEEFAVSAMKQGIFDYILKDRLQRLPVAVQNAVAKYTGEQQQRLSLTEITSRENIMKEAEKLAQQGSWKTDVISGSAWWSDECYRILGFVPGAVTPTRDSFLQAIHPDDVFYVRAVLEDAFNDKQSVQYTCRVLLQDKQERTIQVKMEVERDADSNALSAHGFVREINSEKERNYPGAESQYKEIFDKNPIPLFIMDTETLQFIDANEAAVRHYGYSKEEFHKLSTLDLRPEDEQQRYMQSKKSGISGFMNWGKWRHRKKDGTIIHVEVYADDITAGGRKARLVMTNDITERVLAEEQLQKSEANLRTLFNNTEVGYVLLDKAARVISFNENAARCTEQELNSTLEEGAYAPGYFKENASGVAKAIQKAFEGETRKYEIFYPHANGRDRWLTTYYNPVQDNDRNIISVCVAITDVTEQKLLQIQEQKIAADLQERNSDLEQFAYIITHNLRSPVANITDITNLILSGTVGEEEMPMFLEGLSTASGKLDGVIMDLNNLLLVKYQMSDSQGPVLFSEVLNDVLVSINNSVAKENAQIIGDFVAVNEIVSAKSYIHSIFYNLITNSIKYRRKDVAPEIAISSELQGDKALLIFRDNSIGIDMERKGDQIFGLYKRFHPERAEGKGIGLYMVKTQVETLGGRIRVNSKVNEGTEFIIELPLQ